MRIKAAVLTLIWPLVGACGGDDSLTSPVQQPGHLVVTLDVLGADPAMSGWRLQLDHEPGSPLHPDSSTMFADLVGGRHELLLWSEATNCTVMGENPRTVSVPSGGTARTTFEVQCTSLTGDLEVTASTSGSSLDPNGFRVRVDGGTEWSVATNGLVTISDLDVGDHALKLVGVASNCAVDGGKHRTVSVPSGGTARVRFELTCELPTGLKRIMPTKPFAGSATSLRDAEAMAYSRSGDRLWIADDDSDAVYEIEGSTGAYRYRIRASDVVSAAPDAGVCDDGDGDPNTSCSYTDEFESLAYDHSGGSLYLISTVNAPNRTPPVEKPAVFRFVNQGGRFRLASWHELPAGFDYSAAVVVNGRLYVASGSIIAEYDFSNQRFAATRSDGSPVATLNLGVGIAGLAIEDNSLWVLTKDLLLLEVRWASGEVIETRSLEGLGIARAAGLAVVDADDEILVVDGDDPNSIYVFRE